MANALLTLNQTSTAVGVPTHRLCAHLREQQLIDTNGWPTEHALLNGLFRIAHRASKMATGLTPQHRKAYVTQKGLRQIASDFGVTLRTYA